MPLKHITTEIDVDVEVDMEDFDDDDVKAEYEKRFGVSTVTLEQIYEAFVRRGDAPTVLRDFLYERLWRILP